MMELVGPSKRTGFLVHIIREIQKEFRFSKFHTHIHTQRERGKKREREILFLFFKSKNGIFTLVHLRVICITCIIDREFY